MAQQLIVRGRARWGCRSARAVSANFSDRSIWIPLREHVKPGEEVPGRRWRHLESGDPSPSMGNYLRVMSALGISAGLALLASDTLQVSGTQESPRKRAASAVSVMVKADGSHSAQDLQCLMLHQETVKLMRSDPKLVDQALATLDQWRSSGNSHSQFLWDEWSVILHRRDWRRALSTSRRGRELRQASPLPSVLPASKRAAVLEQVNALKKGVLLGDRKSVV